MSGRTGAQIGSGISKWIRSHKFTSKPAHAVSIIGRVIGNIMEVVGCALFIFESFGSYRENLLRYALICIAGIGVEVGVHWVALQLDKSHVNKLKSNP